MSLPRIPDDADVVYARPEAADAYLWTQFDDNAINGALCIERGDQVHVFENICESNLLLAPVAPTDTVYLYTLETKDSATPDDIVFRLTDGTVVTRYALDGETITMFQEMYDHHGMTVFECPPKDHGEARIIRAYVRWCSRFGYTVYTMAHTNPKDGDNVTIVTEDADAWERFTLDAFFQGCTETDPFAVYASEPGKALSIDTSIPAWYPLAPPGPVH